MYALHANIGTAKPKTKASAAETHHKLLFSLSMQKRNSNPASLSLRRQNGAANSQKRKLRPLPRTVHAASVDGFFIFSSFYLILRLSRIKLPRMKCSTELDGIIARLACPQMEGQLDRLLDLRESASRPDQAGAAVKIYYELLAEKPCSGVVDRPLAALRQWLEKHVKIEVLDDAKMAPYERLPLKFLEAPDLESCCHAAMKHVSDDRCLPASCIRMRFAFAE
jgi:hypothetical protein